MRSRGLLRIHLLAGLATAAALALSQPGPDAWPLAFVALVPWALATAPPRRALLADWAAGLAFFLATVGWIVHVSAIGTGIVVGVSALSFVVAGWLHRRLVGRFPSTVALPLAWCAGETLRAICPPGGFPWAFLSHGLYRVAAFVQIAELGGAPLVSFALAAFNGAVVDLLTGRLRPSRAAIAGAVSGGAPWLYGLVALARLEAPGEGPLVAVVQGNIPQILKDEAAVSRTAEEAEREVLEIFKQHRDLTFSIPEPVDLVVWPETMFPIPLGGGAPGDVYESAVIDGETYSYGHDQALSYEDGLLREGVLDRLEPHRTHLLLGAMYFDRPSTGGSGFRLHNTALLYAPDGRRLDLFHKIHLVPAGEYIPFSGLARFFTDAVGRWIESWAGYFPDLEPGRERKTLSFRDRDGREWRFGIAICYDNAYAEVFRAATRAGAGFHLVLSNEAHYGDSFEMEQLLAASVFRAVETRRALLRATNTGISALVAPSGRVERVLERDGRRKEIEGTLLVRPPVGRGLPVYAAVGDLFAFSALGAGLLLALSGASRRGGDARLKRDRPA